MVDQDFLFISDKSILNKPVLSAMEQKEEIPCAKCRSYKAKEKKFSCNPDDCKDLTLWLLENAPHMQPETLQMQLHIPEKAIQYVV